MLDTARIVDSLNPPQREAVTHPAGPLLILAGAGSGKTRVITHRVAWLVAQQGLDPRGLVAMTFTNKAAGEMRERAEQLLGHELAGAYLGTFHAFGLRLLRANAIAAGYPPTFVVYDSADQQGLVKAALKERSLDDKQFPPKQVLSWISRSKTALIDPDEAQGQARYPDERVLAELYREYEERLRRSGAMDFDDLLVQPIRLFRKHPEIKERYASRIEHLLVDEYQDTNPIQYALVRALSSVHRNVCAVGDEDQSIYAFRGADIRNILDFERDFPDAKIVKLEQNYRSTGNILEAAGSVIRHNAQRHDKTLWTDGPKGAPLVCHEAYDDRSEADFVVDTMLETAKKEGVPLEQCALLYRTNATSRLFEDRLMARNVPYRVVGGLRFYERREIKDLLAWLRLLVHPSSDQDFLRAASTPPRGIGAKTLEAIGDEARSRGGSLFEAAERLVAAPESLGGRATKALDAFLGTRRDLVDMTENTSTAGTVSSVVESIGYMEYLSRAYAQDVEQRAENLGALVNAAQEHDEAGAPEGLAGFLDRVSLRADTDDQRGEKGPSLMTVHSAKGLEFDAVFIVGMNEDLFPHSWAAQSDEGVEEERRLMYVAMTRARKRLFLTLSRFRLTFGQPQLSRPSRFLEEIPPELLHRPRARTLFANDGELRGRGPRMGARTKSLFDEAESPRSATPVAGMERRAGRLSYEPEHDADLGGSVWRPGMKVTHPSFGPGIVLVTEGKGERQRVKIRFQNGQLKKLMPSRTTLIPG